MLKITLGPLDSEAVREIANRRGLQVSDLVSQLIQREAAIEITNWRAQGQRESTPTPITATAQQGAHHVNG